MKRTMEKHIYFRDVFKKKKLYLEKIRDYYQNSHSIALEQQFSFYSAFYMRNSFVRAGIYMRTLREMMNKKHDIFVPIKPYSGISSDVTFMNQYVPLGSRPYLYNMDKWRKSAFNAIRLYKGNWNKRGIINFSIDGKCRDQMAYLMYRYLISTTNEWLFHPDNMNPVYLPTVLYYIAGDFLLADGYDDVFRAMHDLLYYIVTSVFDNYVAVINADKHYCYTTNKVYSVLEQKSKQLYINGVHLFIADKCIYTDADFSDPDIYKKPLYKGNQVYIYKVKKPLNKEFIDYLKSNFNLVNAFFDSYNNRVITTKKDLDKKGSEVFICIGLL